MSQDEKLGESTQEYVSLRGRDVQNCYINHYAPFEDPYFTDNTRRWDDYWRQDWSRDIIPEIDLEDPYIWNPSMVAIWKEKTLAPKFRSVYTNPDMKFYTDGEEVDTEVMLEWFLRIKGEMGL